MPTTSIAPHVVCVSGSLGTASRTNRIASWCADLAERAGARTTVFLGQDIEFPIYRPGDTAAEPEVKAFITALADADGVVLVSPTYHGTVSGLMKNALDYVNELATDERPFLDGRAAGCIAVGAGEQGAATTLATLRTVCHALRAWPTPLGVTISASGDGSDASSDLARERIALLMSQVLFLAKPSARRRHRDAVAVSEQA